MCEYGLIKATDEADSTAKLASLNSKWESQRAGFFGWFLRKKKTKDDKFSHLFCKKKELMFVGPFTKVMSNLSILLKMFSKVSRRKVRGMQLLVSKL